MLESIILLDESVFLTMPGTVFLHSGSFFILSKHFSVIVNAPPAQPRYSKKNQFCRSRSVMLTLAICRYKSAGIATVRSIRNG